jgi:MFS family permease
MNPYTANRIHRILHLLLSHFVAAIISFSVCFVSLMLLHAYQIRNEPYENLRYDSFTTWFITLYIIGSTLFLSLPFMAILQWLQNRHHEKWWRKPLIASLILVVVFQFYDKENMTGLSALVLVIANFLIYWGVFARLCGGCQGPWWSNATPA